MRKSNFANFAKSKILGIFAGTNFREINPNSQNSGNLIPLTFNFLKVYLPFSSKIKHIWAPFDNYLVI